MGEFYEPERKCMRKKIIAGNWKMNMTPTETKELIAKLKYECNKTDVDVVFIVPSIDITTAKECLNGTNIKLGAQNFYYEDNKNQIVQSRKFLFRLIFLLEYYLLI